MIDKVEEDRGVVSVAKSKSGAMAIYNRISDPVAAAKELGEFYYQSGMLGVKSPGAGAVLALSCMCEGITPLEHKRTYHIISGNVTMRSDAMLAEFRKAGGKFKWLDIGENGIAIIHLEFGGNEIDSKYTMEMAEQAKLVKDGGGWTKNPANMLRARAISEGVRMIAPEIVSGFYTPEEVEDITPSQGDVVDVEYDASTPPEPATAKHSNSNNSDNMPVSEPAEHAQEAAQEVPFEASVSKPCTNEQLNEIVEQGALLGQSVDQVSAALVEAYKIGNPSELTFEQARDAIEKMQVVYNEKKSELASQSA